jgi:flagellar hook protein FlgE
MDVIGNNIANVNTEGFKSSSVTFSEIMYQTTSSASGGNGATGIGGVNAKQIGLGVSVGSTTINIEGAGAAETTGNAFDLKLTDSQTTNFFIVSDGTNTMFTRAGSFYVDGNGYLCMSSTGYMVMGWQVDDTGEIRKDTVSGLQVMSTANQTAAPEATTKAYASGVLDKNDSNLSNDGGYVMTLNFYDSLGYSYTAKFSITPSDSGEDGEYYISLTDIIDSNNTSILKDPSDLTGQTYLEGRDPSDLFSTGFTRTVTKSVAQYADDNQNKIYMIDGNLYTIDSKNKVYAVSYDSAAGQYVSSTVAESFSANGSFKDGTYSYVESTPSTYTADLKTVTGATTSYANGLVVTYTDDSNNTVYAILDTASNTLYNAANTSGSTTDFTVGSPINKTNGAITGNANSGYTFSYDYNKQERVEKTVVDFTIDEDSTEPLPYTIVYDRNKGTFIGIGDNGGATDPSATLNLADVILTNMTSSDEVTKSNFSNIEIDFTQSMNYNNNGTSTLKALKGDTDGDGAGKKLGALTGLSVSNDGKIYGSYDNGNTILLGQIAAARFANASGLEKVGENCYQTTLNSGEFDGIGVEITADGSTISSGELEMSNVDLSTEFTSMIVTQRGFQANSRVITTSDTLLEELINLKR